MWLPPCKECLMSDCCFVFSTLAPNSRFMFEGAIPSSDSVFKSKYLQKICKIKTFYFNQSVIKRSHFNQN